MNVSTLNFFKISTSFHKCKKKQLVISNSSHNLIIESILLKQWNVQCAPKNAHLIYSQFSMTICPIFFAQKCEHILYIFELKKSFLTLMCLF
jgi:hypothetical protein